MPPRGPYGRTKIVIATHCRICDMPLNAYNKTGICLHGHINIGEYEEQKAAEPKTPPWQPPQKTKAVSVKPRVRTLTPEENMYAEDLAQAACAVYGMTLADIRNKTLFGIFSEARQAVMYIAFTDGFLSAKIAQFVNRHPSSASQAFQRISLLMKKNADSTDLVDRIRRIREFQSPLLRVPLSKNPR